MSYATLLYSIFLVFKRRKRVYEIKEEEEL
jgi:hypothetical protein